MADPFVRNDRDKDRIDWDYTLVSDVTIILNNPYFIPAAEFKNEWLWIRVENGKVAVTVFKNYSWDGPTGVPDIQGTILASVYHDAIYQFVRAIMPVWNTGLNRTLRFADDVFLQGMLDYHTDRVSAYTYYYGVRALGTPFHLINEWI